MKEQVAELFSNVDTRKLKMELPSASSEGSSSSGGKGPEVEKDQASPHDWPVYLFASSFSLLLYLPLWLCTKYLEIY